MPVWVFFKALPTWVKVGAAAGLLIGALEVRHWWTTRDLRRDLAKQEELLKQEQEAAAQRELAIQQGEQNRAQLEAEIENQNRRINSIAATARNAQNAAALAALREVQAGAAVAEELRKPTTDVPVGPAAMNEWLRKRVEAAK